MIAARALPSVAVPTWSESEAATFDAFVVPHYLVHFSSLALERLAVSPDAQVIHAHCRTGHFDAEIAAKLPNAHVYGCDASEAALSLARARRARSTAAGGDYILLTNARIPLPDGAFSHALSLHPEGPAEFQWVLEESARLLGHAGQLVVAAPLADSFPELLDLLREFALKFDSHDTQRAIERAAVGLSTVDSMVANARAAGFAYLDVATRTTTVSFRSGRDFVESPILRLGIAPCVADALANEDALAYVRDAIDKYYSTFPFELTFTVGCLTASRS